MLNRLLGMGPAQFFKGLREGDVPVLVFGALLLVWRLSRRQRSSKTASIKVKPGKSVAMRVTRAGADPVTYRIDA